MRKNKVFVTIYGLTSQLHVNLVGRLNGSEIFALLYLPFINIGSLLKSNNALKKIVILLTILLIAQIFSDIYNQSTPENYLRGWAVILFSIISILFLTHHFERDPQAIVYYLFSLFIVKLFFGSEALDFTIIEENSNFFKTRFVEFLNYGTLIISYYLFKSKRLKFTYIIIATYALICIILDARSNGIILLITTLIIFIKASKIKLTKVKLVFFLTILIPVFYMLYIVYVNNVISGEISGKNSQDQINKMSNPYNPFELLYYGRSDAVIAIHAIAEKPLLGHGSWAQDPFEKYAALREELFQTVFHSSGFIPAHSIILSSWLYSGIIGFFALLYVYSILIKKSFNMIKHSLNEFTPIIVFISIEMIWNMLFSPYGHLRTSFPFLVATLIVLNNTSPLNKLKN